jgi:hypothetical protein
MAVVRQPKMAMKSPALKAPAAWRLAVLVKMAATESSPA